MQLIHLRSLYKNQDFLFTNSLPSCFFVSFRFLVSFVIEAAIAANATASTASTASVPSTDVKGVGDGETKNKRQVNDYLRTPGTSVDRSLNDQGPQAFPLQLSHGIYNQPRVPLYTRRPTSNVAHKPQVTEDDVEQEHQRQVRLFIRSCFLFLELACKNA